MFNKKRMKQKLKQSSLISQIWLLLLLLLVVRVLTTFLLTIQLFKSVGSYSANHISYTTARTCEKELAFINSCFL